MVAANKEAFKPRVKSDGVAIIPSWVRWPFKNIRLKGDSGFFFLRMFCLFHLFLGMYWHYLFSTLEREWPHIHGVLTITVLLVDYECGSHLLGDFDCQKIKTKR